MDFDAQYKKYLDFFNAYAEEFFSKYTEDLPPVLGESMYYAVEGGGKRVRPILFFAACDALGIDYESYKEYALAIECIHSYSLVHDDLPAMDNDDYRRGKLSTHKKFGEANGILAGDGLLNLAFEILFSRNITDKNELNACRVIAECVGAKGMVGGQVLDLENENKKSDEKTLTAIYENKTAKLILAPLLSASAISGGKYDDSFYEFGYNFGLMFQVTDDILDVTADFETLGKTPKKDEKSDKFTSVSLYGLDGAREKAREYYNVCKKALSELPDSEFLSVLLEKTYSRKR